MKIYLAAPYACRNALLTHRAQLEQLGHRVTSTWLNATTAITPGHLGTSPRQPDAYAHDHVSSDIFDVRRSDLLILFTWTASQEMLPGDDLGPNSGGRHVETGVAMGAGIPVLVVGEKENIFHRARSVTHVVTWMEALDHLRDVYSTDPALF